MKCLFQVGALLLLLAFFASPFQNGTILGDNQHSVSNTDDAFQQHWGFGLAVSSEITTAQLIPTELPEEQPSLYQKASSFWTFITPKHLRSGKPSAIFPVYHNILLLANLKRLIFPFHSFW